MIGTPSLICRNALQSILNIGWHHFRMATGLNVFQACGLSGRIVIESNRGREMTAIHMALHEFSGALKNESTLFATILIYEATGMTTRDDDPDDVALPHIFLSTTAMLDIYGILLFI